ncbi:MAG: methylthioribulose 1-phosphate dehydratase [Gammaproteobacteria bacterium]
MNDFNQRAHEIIEAGRSLYQMGLVPATSGNFSTRLADGNIAITVSGRHKGKLTEVDIMLVDREGKPLDARQPSAETGLHTQIYHHFAEAGAILHPHSMNAVLLSQRYPDFVSLSQYELLKAFADITTHATEVIVPVFDNDQDIPRLAAKVQDYLDHNDHVYGYIIANHGFYTWGRTMSETLRYVEAFEYLFACTLQSGG